LSNLPPQKNPKVDSLAKQMKDKKINSQAGDYIEFELENPFEDKDNEPGNPLKYYLYQREVSGSSVISTADNGSEKPTSVDNSSKTTANSTNVTTNNT